MTFQSDQNGEEGDGGPSGASYAVGFRKPPVQHQFKKGRSGNPRGRPRKANVAKKQDPLGFGLQPTKEYLLQEAYRTVLVREGDRTIELPAIQAVFRAMGVAAMKGSRYAQRMLADMVQSVEAEGRVSRLGHFQAMMEYKYDWEKVIEQARELGEPEPQPIPHPDDVIIDFEWANATICGPKTKEEKATWDTLLEYRDEIQIEVSMLAANCRKKEGTDSHAAALDAWKFHQKLYDRMNDNLPKRYRKHLADRCRLDGASRPGEQRKRIWPGGD